MVTSTLNTQTTKVWVYQAPRKLETGELQTVKSKLTDFVDSWSSHGAVVNGCFEINHDQFIVVMADEASAGVSGCSIDGSVRVIKELESDLGLSLLDKSVVAFQIGSEIVTMDFREIPKAVSSGKITAETLFFDNSINTLEQFQQRWKVPAKDSWVARYFN